MTRKVVEIDNWCQDGECLLGIVKGHPKFGDTNEAVRTSPVIRLDLDAGIAETKWTTYKLGTKRKNWTTYQLVNEGKK